MDLVLYWPLLCEQHSSATLRRFDQMIPTFTCFGRPWWINWVNGKPPPKKTLICSIACPTMFNRNIFYVYNIDLLETSVCFSPPHDSKTSRTFQEVWFLAQFDQVFFPKKKQPTIWCCGRLPRIVSLWCCSEGECSQEPRASGSNWSPKKEDPVDSPWQNMAKHGKTQGKTTLGSTYKRMCQTMGGQPEVMIYWSWWVNSTSV